MIVLPERAISPATKAASVAISSGIPICFVIMLPPTAILSPNYRSPIDVATDAGAIPMIAMCSLYSSAIACVIAVKPALDIP